MLQELKNNQIHRNKLYHLMKIQHGLNLLKKRLKHIKKLKIINKKKLKYMIKIIKENKYNIIKYMKYIKISQHMI